MAVNKSSASFKRNKQNVKRELNSIRKNLQHVINNLEDGAITSLGEIAQTIHNTSNKYAPMDTGELIDSSYIDHIETPDKIVYEIGYTADHAIYAHENAGRGHDYKDPTTPNTHWKFLQRAASEVVDDIPKIVKDAEENKLRKGVK